MSNVNDNTAGRYPDAWHEFDSFVARGFYPQDIGFYLGLQFVNRWVARYRAAASFESANFADYLTPQIAGGYTELIRGVLVWSAFERFLPLLGLEQKTSDRLLDKHHGLEVLRSVRETDEHDKLFTYIYSALDSKYQKQKLERYFDNNNVNASYLLSAIRHTFVHGYLSPSANQTDPRITSRICNILGIFHLGVMNNEFTDWIEQFKRQI